MIKLFRFCAIFIPKPNGLISRAKYRAKKIGWAFMDVRDRLRFYFRFRDMYSFREAMRRDFFADPDLYNLEDRASAHRIEGTTLQDGRIFVREWTNDNLDQGVPNECAEWDWTAKDRAAFAKRAGRSRTGCSGVKVTITLDGKRI